MEDKRFARLLKYYKSIMPFRSPNFDEFGALHFWTKRFGGLDEEKITAVFNRAMSELDHFPSVREFTEYLGGGRADGASESKQVAALIVGSVSRFGWNNSKMAEEAIGPLGWKVVEMSGGWPQICNILTDRNTSTLTAQWRDLAASLAEKERLGITALPGADNEVKGVSAAVQLALGGKSEK